MPRNRKISSAIKRLEERNPAALFTVENFVTVYKIDKSADKVKYMENMITKFNELSTKRMAFCVSTH